MQVGECGAPTQEARCPDCGMMIGGLQHSTADPTADQFLLEATGDA
jgi:hypothetical protein